MQNKNILRKELSVVNKEESRSITNFILKKWPTLEEIGETSG